MKKIFAIFGLCSLGVFGTQKITVQNGGLTFAWENDGSAQKPYIFSNYPLVLFGENDPYTVYKKAHTCLGIVVPIALGVKKT